MRSKNRLSIPNTTHQIRTNSDCIYNSLSSQNPPGIAAVLRTDPFQNLQRVGNQTPKLKPVCPARRVVKRSSADRRLKIYSHPLTRNIIPEPPVATQPIFFSAYSSPRQLIRKAKILKDQRNLSVITKEQDIISIRIRKIPSSCIRDATRKTDTKVRDRVNSAYSALTLDRIKTPKFHAELKPDYISLESYSCSSESTCLPSTNHSTPVSSSKANSPRHITNQSLLEKLKRDNLKGAELYIPATAEIPQDMSFGDIYSNL